MFDRPTTALWGIGTKTARKLAELGINTVRELAAADPAVVAARLGPQHRSMDGGARPGGRPAHGDRHALGGPFAQPGDDVPAESHRVGGDPPETAALAFRVHQDVVADGREVGRVAVKVRFAPFFTATKSAKLPAADRRSRPADGGGAGRPGAVRAGPGSAVVGRACGVRPRLTPPLPPRRSRTRKACQRGHFVCSTPTELPLTDSRGVTGFRGAVEATGMRGGHPSCINELRH